MTWFRVDDQFATHPKALRAGNQACGLWVRAGSWSGAQLTDGHIGADMVTLLGGRAADIRKLIDAGLWHEKGHDCTKCPEPTEDYLFHEWGAHQPTKTQVTSRREADAERKAAARAGRSGAKRPGLKVVDNG